MLFLCLAFAKRPLHLVWLQAKFHFRLQAKIKKIHLACQKGDLREVLHNLDRRKFAVGRENWSGLRMTPLHTSVLYRNSAIVRYLAGRFPESLHARDIHGRTPLHYAGTLPDKTFYNLLLTLGAYQTLLDNVSLLFLLWSMTGLCHMTLMFLCTLHVSCKHNY